MTIGKNWNDVETPSDVDKFLATLKAVIKRDPLATGVIAGIIFGAAADSGAVFFFAVAIVTALGWHWSQRNDA